MPRAQINERSALCLLALLDPYAQEGVARINCSAYRYHTDNGLGARAYRKDYAPNTRETFRRQTMHQFVQAGIANYNPDLPGRPVNSPAVISWETDVWIADEPSHLIHFNGVRFLGPYPHT